MDFQHYLDLYNKRFKRKITKEIFHMEIKDETEEEIIEQIDDYVNERLLDCYNKIFGVYQEIENDLDFGNIYYIDKMYDAHEDGIRFIQAVFPKLEKRCQEILSKLK